MWALLLLLKSAYAEKSPTTVDLVEHSDFQKEFFLAQQAFAGATYYACVATETSLSEMFH